ncbi:hypothetical protein BDP27DRAFT_1285841 [Rhodocollybia butyracea]|uniref:Uncharacterized protein n=1 Tax=Rhodocollybia butyracea TaxID=206335 RepID=A0A9P5Q7D5_9AGAR|nr:hypothetical protein BDP27DRAFT_1285841 [Rhodocollybia butyracea]
MSTSAFTPSLVGSVFERKPLASNSSTQSQSRFSNSINSKTGFPPVQHRSQKNSAFLKNRDESRRKPELSTERTTDVPHVASASATAGPGPRTMQNHAKDGWMSQISAENEARVQAMTEEERDAERRQILERFGPGVGDILRRAREKREAGNTFALEEVPLTSEEPLPSPSPLNPASRSSSLSGTRPNSPNRASRKLRFAELAPDQVHVYPSAPSSPKKQLLALPPPDPNGDAVSLGTFKGQLKPPVPPLVNDGEYEEEGTPEYIRKKYFPSAPADNPDLAWMSSTLAPLPDQISDLRFDLTGKPIPSSKILSLPTHLGLHHHAEGTRAGYTLDDIFLLTRSTVRAQRAAMFDVLVGVVRWLRADEEDAELNVARKTLLSQSDSESSSQTTQPPPILKRILFVGLEALPERGVVGVKAMDLVWECIVGHLNRLEDSEFEFELGVGMEEEMDDPDLLTSLPLTDVLPQFLNLLLSDLGQDSPTPTQQQILSILTRVAQYSNTFADSVVKEKGLIEGLLKVFIIPLPSSTTTASNPSLSAIRLLIILASASRTNAEALSSRIGAGDILLRFVVSSHYDSAVIVEIMHFYTVLARYGLYSSVAADAKEVWWKFGLELTTSASMSNNIPDSRLIRAYVGLLESWIVCAIDPHRTTPDHQVLWSQVKGWEWGAGLTSLWDKFTCNHLDSVDYLSTSASLWRSLAAYLEGAKVNGARGGEDERAEVCLVLKPLFDTRAFQKLKALVEDLQQKLKTLTDVEADTILANKEIASGTTILFSAIRLWLGCSGPIGSPPPFELPFTDISRLCASITGHGLWDRKTHPLLLRPLSTLLVLFLRLSPHLPDSHPDLWLAQAFGVSHILQRGDEEYMSKILNQILGTVTPDWAAQRGGVGAPSPVWEQKGGLKGVLGPFLNYEVNPQRAAYAYIAPLCSSPISISMCTTLRVPSASSPTRRTANAEWRPLGLPLHSDWTLSPINHLLRSGSEHSIFQQHGALPDAWDASETEVVRATLALTRVELEVTRRFAPSILGTVGLKKEDVVLACMKVFMLEHGVGTGNAKVQPDGERSLQEVFRDEVVGRQMLDLIDSYTIKASPTSSSHPEPPPSPSSSQAPLEAASFHFLGTSVPFYQFYTDFVSLYDSISFSQPLFSRLLIPPTSMLYASDYRKLLWNDYGHVLRGIRIEVGDVITGNGGTEEWMYPVETEPEVLGAYLRALVKYGSSGGLQGFTRFLAVHHIAANIWPGYRTDGDLVEGVGADDERRSKLLRAVIDQASPDVVREVLKYRQSSGGVLLPPNCFDNIDEPTKNRRCTFISEWGGEGSFERVKKVFEE